MDLMSSLCQMRLQRAAGLQRCFCLSLVAEGLVALGREVFLLRPIFSATNSASMTHRTAAKRHSICQTQHGWGGKARLLHSFRLSVLFLSHAVRSCKRPPPLLAAVDQVSLAKKREAVSGLCCQPWPELD